MLAEWIGQHRDVLVMLGLFTAFVWSTIRALNLHIHHVVRRTANGAGAYKMARRMGAGRKRRRRR